MVEVDVQGCCAHLDHTWLEDMLRVRIDERAFLKRIRKWLKAGILATDGQVSHPEAGTPPRWYGVPRPGKRIRALCPGRVG